jgi:hypothetical protein
MFELRMRDLGAGLGGVRLGAGLGGVRLGAGLGGVRLGAGLGTGLGGVRAGTEAAQVASLDTHPTRTPFVFAHSAAVSISAPLHPSDPSMPPQVRTSCILGNGTTRPAAMLALYANAVQNAQAQQLPHIPWLTMGCGMVGGNFWSHARFTSPGHLSAHCQFFGNALWEVADLESVDLLRSMLADMKHPSILCAFSRSMAGVAVNVAVEDWLFMILDSCSALAGSTPLDGTPLATTRSTSSSSSFAADRIEAFL